MKRKRQFVICLDFDGVIHWNISKWCGRAKILDGVIPGTKDAIRELRRGGRVVVFSGRCISDDGINAIQTWLGNHDIEVDAVCRHKPMADVYIDDRAIQFNGNWTETIDAVKGFDHWQRIGKDAWRRKQRKHRGSFRTI
ncbi:MAG: hypothetical protein GY942_05440 [Aestuariibacter sp.]|nr:hypothetical protein [Aestuariibacter sp.]